MKKNTTYLLLGILIILIILFLYFNSHKEKDTIDFGVSFAVPQTHKIDQINIGQGSTRSLILTKEKGFWLINDSLRAQKEQIDLLLNTLAKMEIKYIPPRAAVPGIMDDLKRNGVNVNVFSNDRIMQTFTMGGVTSDERGTYGIKTNDDYPYVLHLPGWEGSLRPRFIKPLNEWRDRYFVRLTPPKITQIIVDYPLQQEHSFKLDRSSGDWILYDPRGQESTQLNSNSVQAYLEEFRQIGAEAYLTDMTLIEQYRTRVPHALITVMGDKNIRIPVFAIQYEDGRLDQERYHILMSDKELVLAQRRILGKILKPYNYFEVQ